MEMPYVSAYALTRVDLRLVTDQPEKMERRNALYALYATHMIDVLVHMSKYVAVRSRLRRVLWSCWGVGAAVRSLYVRST